MPELPDVEMFKRYLDATSLHQRIDDIGGRNAYVLKDTSPRELARELKGRHFESSRRHGKHLFVRADDEILLRLHFGMTGSLQYLKKSEQVPRHTRVLFVFAKGHSLAFDDQRQFGQIGLVKDVDEFLKKSPLGPDALEIDLEEFRKNPQETSGRGEIAFAQSEIDRGNRKHLCRRNSFLCADSSRDGNLALGRQSTRKAFPHHALHSGKIDRSQS